MEGLSGLVGATVRAVELPFAEAAIETRYYTPAVHLAAFALPRYIMDEMK